jgi:RNA polymerase sigma-70 factor (ECF subfamily)
MDQPGRSPEFPSTSWSLIREAALTGVPESREALARLCARYWYPLYAFIRRTGHGQEDAQDLVQGFFARFLERNYLRGLDPADGRFRSYLLAAVKHYLANEADRASAQKRGAGVTVPLDLEEGERRFTEHAVGVSPELEYERKWAHTFLDNVLAALRAEYEQSGRAEQFEHLSTFLPGARDSLSYKQAAERMGLGLQATKAAIHRMRRSYSETLRREVARTVSSSDEIEAEIRYLIAVLER